MTYEQIFRRSPVPLLVLDVDTWTPREFNDVAAETMGYSRQEFSRLTISDFEMVPRPEETRTHIDRIRSVGRDRFPALHRAKGGAEIRVEVDVQMMSWRGRPAMLTAWHRLAEEVVQGQTESGPTDVEEGRGAAHPGPVQPGVVARSRAMQRVLSDADRVAATDLAVLLLGESGTGKEVVARRIHDRSRRRQRSFMPINCGGLPQDLADAELFGAERGAFTGADRRRLGRIEVADGGTVFLDEVGELSPALQTRLLRTLQTGEIHRLGAPRPTRVDVRVVAATNRDLHAMVRDGNFREDLYYRLAGLVVEIPPLRDRPEDVRGLVDLELSTLRRDQHPHVLGFTEADLHALEQREWRGNVRELFSVVRRAVAFADHDRPILESSPTTGPRPGPAPALRLDDAIRAHLLRTLESCQWIIEGPAGAAQRLGLRPSTLRSKIARLGLCRPH